MGYDMMCVCVGYFSLSNIDMLHVDSGILYASFAFATLGRDFYAFNTFRIFVPNAISVVNKEFESSFSSLPSFPPVIVI